MFQLNDKFQDLFHLKGKNSNGWDEEIGVKRADVFTNCRTYITINVYQMGGDSSMYFVLFGWKIATKGQPTVIYTARRLNRPPAHWR